MSSGSKNTILRTNSLVHRKGINMKKIHIVEGIMGIVGKVSSFVAKIIKGKKIEEAFEKEVALENVENLQSIDEKMPSKLQGKLRLKKVQILQQIEDFKKEKLEQRQEDSQQEAVTEIGKFKEIHMKVYRDRVKDRRALQLHVGLTHKNKEGAPPLHRQATTNNKVIYLHQRAPTYFIQAKERGRKRGTGT